MLSFIKRYWLQRQREQDRLDYRIAMLHTIDRALFPADPSMLTPEQSDKLARSPMAAHGEAEAYALLRSAGRLP